MQERVSNEQLEARLASHFSSSGDCRCEHCKERRDLLDARKERDEAGDGLRSAREEGSMSKSFEEAWKEAEADLIEHGSSLAGFKAWAWLGLRHAAHVEGFSEGYQAGEATARAAGEERR